MNPGTDLELLRGVCRRGIPPLPSAAIRLALELAADEGSTNEALIDQLESDARLRFAVLAAGNLTMLSGNRPVKTIRHAVGQIGRRKCLSLLWLVALSDLLRSWPNLHETARDKLWRHSLLTGVLTQQLLAAAGLAALGDGPGVGATRDARTLAPGSVSAPGGDRAAARIAAARRAPGQCARRVKPRVVHLRSGSGDARPASRAVKHQRG